MFALEFTHCFPHTELFAGFHEARDVIEDEESGHLQALHDELSEAGKRGILFGVAGDKSAEHDAAVKVHAIENRVHDFATHIFKVDVDTLGSGGNELFFPLRVFVVDGGVEAEVVEQPEALFVASGNSHHAAAIHFAELTGDAAGGARSGRDDKRFASFRLADIEQAEIGGESIDAENAEEIGVGKKGDEGDLVEGWGVDGVDDDVVL